ncbi:thermonuclease family protein [Marinomonas transparens]|uniref:Thermonuclease family protein n=1 Tax=Marinomonas transparens TaxID=2795388 RepID=A0A934JVJ1_9GAMM|nr:thermonuclease family protein [Marinomonas transparens]MBJ7538085.1 thermonuclease family protein [Marinomonas transparens]
MTVIRSKKRQVVLALFLFLPSIAVHADNGACLAQGELEKARIKRVVDGDTMHLADGRKVRLVGINTPELDHKSGHHQPYALEAKALLTVLAGDYVYLQKSKNERDRYGRYLYYLFNKDRISLTSQLLFEGLGYRVAVPPNLAYQTCFEGAENNARNAYKGLWQQVLQWQPQAGFVLSRITITSITHNRGGWWLETDKNLVINLPSNAADYWPAQKVFYLEGKMVEVRGWQHQRKSRHSDFTSWVLLVRHPNDLREVKDFFDH